MAATRRAGATATRALHRVGDICRRENALAISLFFGIWAAVWLAGWLTGVYFFTGSDLPAFIGGYLGCVSGALITYRTMGRLRPGSRAYASGERPL